MKLAMQQTQEIQRARQAIENLLGGKIDPPVPEKKLSSDKSRSSSSRSKMDLKAQFSEPPAPPPQAPLPEKPDVARALADPLIQPLLRRTDTAKPQSGSASPTRIDHSSDIIRLCEELKLARGELNNQSERMKSLENELAQERTARESAEERAQQLQDSESERADSVTNNGHPSAENSPTSKETIPPPDLEAQMDRLRASMDEMKQQMELYRTRAESAEAERDEVRQTLAEMVEQKRKENAERASATIRSSSRSPKALSSQSPPQLDGSPDLNGHAVSPHSTIRPTSGSLLQRAGVEEGQPITPAQAKLLTQFLTHEVLGPETANSVAVSKDGALLYYGSPYASFAAVVLMGYFAMSYINSWPKVER
jgi:hypothetical protein